METVCITGSDKITKKYAIIPSNIKAPVQSPEELRRLDPPPAMTKEDLEKFRQLNLADEYLESVKKLSRPMRDVWFQVFSHQKKRAAKKAAQEQAELEALTRGELTPAMRQQQELAERSRRLMEEAEQQYRQQVAKKYQDKYAITQAGLPLAFQHDMDYILQRGVPAQLEYASQRVTSFIENLDACVKKGSGLFFIGPVGTLKTTFACAILLAGFRAGIEGRFEMVPELLDKLVYLEKTNQEEYHRTMERLCRVPLLVLDDIGAEAKRGEFVHAKIEQIIFRRHANLLPIIITTNSTHRELQEKYTDRIMDRLAERCYLLPTEGPSNRGRA